MTAAEAVVDASVVVRGLTADGEAAGFFALIAAGETRAHAPDLVVAEVANALALAVRTERRSLGDAQTLLGLFTETPIELHPTTPLAPAALELAARSVLSVYDSLYAVLGAALGVPLLTADQRLADAVPGSVLVS